MRNSTLRRLAAALIHLAGIVSLCAVDSDFIISEWVPAIQTIRLESFSTWPGTSDGMPIDASFAGCRIVLVFPETVVSLDDSGGADERSLLALFATQSTARDTSPWSPSAGTVCSDGAWRRWSADGPELRERDLVTGRVRRTPWNGPPVESLHALPGGRILAVSGGGAYAAERSGETFLLAEGLPPLSLAAVSSSDSRIAWMDASSEGIRFADESGRIWERTISGGPFPASMPWSMAWAGDLVVTAWPGRLVAVDGRPGGGDSPFRTFVFEDGRLPDRWYRLYGGEGRLMIHSPESGIIAVLGTADGNLGIDVPSRAPAAGAGGPRRPDEARIPRFIDLVGRHALAAADLVEAEGGASPAERFCTWILPYVRKFRSERPMDTLWPELESELTRRRALFMDIGE